MDLNMRKEQFGNAYVRAIAATAGFVCYKQDPDIDSVDWGIAAAGGQGSMRSPHLELQLKCTSRNVMDTKDIAYPLPIKNYEELRPKDFQVPRILVVVVMPEDEADWLAQSEDELALRHCGYWISLRGMEETSNTSSVTIKVPRAQQFTVDSLRQMMGRIEGGDQP